jgi:hypothetical protein
MAMRSHHILALVAVLAVVIGLNWLFFFNRAAETQPEPGPNATQDVLQMQQQRKDLPVMEISDPI